MRTWLPIGIFLATAATCALPGYDFKAGAGAAGGTGGAAGGLGGVGGGQGGALEGGGGQGGAMACPPPVENYDFDGCGGADLQFDEDHCGACDRSCLGAQCTQGRCELLPFGDEVLSVRDILPLEGDRLLIAVDGAPSLVWKLGQATPVPLVGSTRPNALAEHEGTVYFSDEGDAGQGGGGGGPRPGGVFQFDDTFDATQLGIKSGTFGLHVDDRGIYFVENWWGGVSAWLFTESEQRTLYASGTNSVLGVNYVEVVLTAGTNYAYFAIFDAHGGKERGVYRVVKEGSPNTVPEPELLVSLDEARSITDLLAIDGYLYIAEEQRDAGESCLDGSVRRAPITQDGIGQLEILESTAQCPHGFEVDEHFVYWLHRAAPGTGNVMRFSRFCNLPVEVLQSGLDEPQFLRVTGDAMFLGEWLGNNDTRLSKSTKTLDP